jgi:hypothetical protein
VSDGAYRGFSADFERYLALIGRSTDAWRTWTKVENGLRDLVERRLVEEFGVEWEGEARRHRPQLAKLLDECDGRRKREQRSYGPLASERLVDFTYPRDLCSLINGFWSLFSDVLGHDTRYWNDRFEMFAKVRNPMAHNRISAVSGAERQTFLGYCEELTALLSTHTMRQISPADSA